MVDRWQEQWDPTDTGKDVDSDYLGKFGQDNEPESATDALADDPTVGEEKFNPNTDHEDYYEHDFECEFEFTFSKQSGARTMWPSRHKDAFRAGGPEYKNNAGLPRNRGKCDPEFRRIDDDNYRYVNAIVNRLFPSKGEQFIDNIIFLILDDPYLNSSWSRHYNGLLGAAVGYCGVILDSDSPVKAIDELMGVQPHFEEKSDVRDVIEYAEKRIDERDIDVTQY